MITTRISDNSHTDLYANVIFCCTFSMVCFKSNNQVTQTLSVTQLAKHHCKHLISKSELLYITIAVILANLVVELNPIQESCELNKNVSILKHSSQTIIPTKLLFKFASFQEPT